MVPAHRIVFFLISSEVQDLFLLYFRRGTVSIRIFLEYGRARKGTNRTQIKIDFQVTNSIAVGERSQSTIKRASGIIKKLSMLLVANYIISNPTYYERIAANLTGEFPSKEEKE